MVNRDSYHRKLKKERLSVLAQQTVSDDIDSDSQKSKADSQKVHGKSGVVIEETEKKQKVTRSFSWLIPLGVPPLIVVAAVLLMLILPKIGAQGEEYDYKYIGPLPVNHVSSYRETVADVFPSKRCMPKTEIVDPEINASSYVSVYADSFHTLFEKDPDMQLPFASIVKLLGALVVVDSFDMDESMGLLEWVDAEGNGMDLEVGEKASVRELLGAALVGSRNDAMYALAQNYPGGTAAFVAQMQLAADRIGMTSTTVENVIGLDSPSQRSTARDVAVLMISVMKEKEIASLLILPSITVNTSWGREEVIWSTNTLLGKVEGVVAGKTGYTQEAGLSLVTYVDAEPDFVTVVLNAGDRYGETEKLIAAVKESYDCQ